MGTPTIIKGEEYFNTVIYEGNGKGQRVGNFIPFTDQATIANSCIFNDADSARLERTPSSGGNQRVLTVSMWFKLGTLGVRGTLFSAAPSGDTGNFVHQVEIFLRLL